MADKTDVEHEFQGPYCYEYVHKSDLVVNSRGHDASRDESHVDDDWQYNDAESYTNTYSIQSVVKSEGNEEEELSQSGRVGAVEAMASDPSCIDEIHPKGGGEGQGELTVSFTHPSTGEYCTATYTIEA